MRSQLRTHGFRFFWLVFIIALTIVPQSTFAFPQSTQGDGLRSHHRVVPFRRTILETAPTSEVIQNNAFAHLTVTPGLASIKCGFVNPDDTYEFIGIKFFLYGWDEGADQKETIEGSGEFVISDREVRINTSRVIPEFEYYLLQCHNRIFNIEGQWSTLITAESRFGRIAPFNGIYERTGEVTSDRAILHTYLTEKPAPDPTGEAPLRVPPMAGHVQFRVYADPGLRKLVAKSQYFNVDDYINVDKEWRRVNYNVRWTVKNLLPDRKYFYQVRTRSSDRSEIRVASNINSFKTAPLSNSDHSVEFVAVGNLDPYNTEYTSAEESQKFGLKSFASMLNYNNRAPDFILLTGDTVYYDDNRFTPDVDYPGRSYQLRWQVWPAQYRFENMLNFFSQVPGYWMVDDHDYWKNNYTEITEDGWYIFRNSNPTPGSYGMAGEDAEIYYEQNPYGTSKGSGTDFWRVIRWGQHLELFIEEGRHHRDHENDLIWGTEQRLWLQNRINESDATYKIIITTTPVLAPLGDPPIYEYADKHANSRFREETLAFLNETKDMPDVFFICGDRHWKHFSVINQSNYPEFSDFHEFCVGSAAGGEHAIVPELTENEWGSMLYVDTIPSAGYLRVQIRPQIDRVKIKFELIKVAEELDNEVLYSVSYAVPIGTDPGDYSK